MYIILYFITVFFCAILPNYFLARVAKQIPYVVSKYHAGLRTNSVHNLGYLLLCSFKSCWGELLLVIIRKGTRKDFKQYRLETVTFANQLQ